jgi:hypothetical protein
VLHVPSLMKSAVESEAYGPYFFSVVFDVTSMGHLANLTPEWVLLIEPNPPCKCHLVTGLIHSKQEKLWKARKAPQLAPPELETERSWLRPTYLTWFARTALIWSASTGPNQKRDFQNLQIGYYRIIILGIMLSSDHSFEPSMTHEVYLSEIKRPCCPLEVHTSTIFLIMRFEPSRHVFSVIDLTSMGTMNYITLLNSAQNHKVQSYLPCTVLYECSC